MQRKLKMLAVAGALTLTATATTAASASAATVYGAGSTLVQPLVQVWATDYNSLTGNSINYQGVGSGTGIKDVTQRQVNFGASDAPLTSQQATSCGDCIQIPWALSATGIGYNLPGVGKLRLTPDNLVRIYLGQISNWNDPRLKAVNPGVNLPDLAITPIFRSDGSGDTYAFTDFLSSQSDTWFTKVGRGTSVSFPKGVGGKGNSGVAAVLQNTQGGIAYIAAPYLIGQKIPAARIRNRAGNFRSPNLSNIKNAAASVKAVPGDEELHIVNPPKAFRTAYPISTFTYAIVHTSGNGDPRDLRDFLGYVLTRGQRFGANLDFAPLPGIVIRASRSHVGQVK